MSEYTFRLLVTSDIPNALVYNLERRLTSIQSTFRFDVHRESIPAPDDNRPTRQAEALEAIALEVGRNRYPGD